MTSSLRLADILRSGLAALILPVLLAPIPLAQTVPPAPPEAPIHTLHVYMDLIQIPVLVLDSEMELMKPIDTSRFRISLDSGPVFHPRTVRPEWDDPISLAILLDANAESSLMPQISEAISSLAPGSLHPADHISIYGLDCSLTRSLLNVPANPVLLKEAVDRALAKWTERHQTRHARPCHQKLQLWDAMGYLVKQLREVPGRRVMLVVSDGSDHGSVATWSDIRAFTQEAGVAVFGCSTPNVRNSPYRIGPAMTDGHAYRSSGMLPSVRSGNSPEDPFNIICQVSGGIVLAADERSFQRTLHGSPRSSARATSLSSPALVTTRPVSTAFLSPSTKAPQPISGPRESSSPCVTLPSMPTPAPSHAMLPTPPNLASASPCIDVVPAYGRSQARTLHY